MDMLLQRLVDYQRALTCWKSTLSRSTKGYRMKPAIEECETEIDTLKTQVKEWLDK